MKNRKFIAALTTGVMAASLTVPAFAAVDVASTDLTLVINDKVVESNEEIGQPFITSDGRTMVPLRLVSETSVIKPVGLQMAPFILVVETALLM